MDKIKAGKRLKKLRLDRMETLATVAQAVGITVQALSLYEKGLRIPRDEIKLKLANYFNTTVDAIFFAE